MTASLLVDLLEVRVPQEAHASRKLAAGFAASIRRVGGPVRSGIAHNNSCSQLDLQAPNAREMGRLLAEAGLHRDPLATLGAPP